jgi:phenolphthiocerol/phthiocerol/phthiodiolone dimycocerosyl transferase
MLKRRLDDIETLLRNIPGTIVVEYRGDLDRDALVTAFHRLAGRYPVLTGRVRSTGAVHCLEVDPDRSPQAVVLPGDERTLRQEIYGAWDASMGVARLICVRGDDRGFVALRVDHSVFDAAMMTAVLRQLWVVYTSLLGGREAELAHRHELPASPAGLLNERWATVRSLVAPSLDLPEMSDIHSCRIRLGEAATSVLADTARQHGSSLHGLLCGVVLHAQRAQSPVVAPAPMSCVSMVDLRNRIEPPVGVLEVANLVAHHKAELVVEAAADPVALGKQLRVQLEEAIAGRQLWLPTDHGRWSHYVDSVLGRHLATAVINNLGPTPRLPEPDGLAIVDVTVPPLAERAPVDYPSYTVHGYAGELTMWCSFPALHYTESEAWRVAHLIEHKLWRLSTVVAQ